MLEKRPTKNLLVRGEEAEVFRYDERTRNKKRDIVRIKPMVLNARKSAFAKFRKLKLANAIFPELFITPTRSIHSKETLDGTNYLMSRYEETTPEYVDFVKAFYSWLRNRKSSFPSDHPHMVEYNKKIRYIRELLESAGISAQLHPANVGFRPDGSAVLFEINEIDIAKASIHIYYMPQSKQKRLAERELARYNRFIKAHNYQNQTKILRNPI